MPSFRIFYFRHSVLDHAEEIEVSDVLDSVRQASGKAPGLKAEIWSDKGKVGIVGRPRDPAHHHIQFIPKGRPRVPR